MNDIVFYESIESIDQEKWKTFYNSHPRKNAFQNFEMYEFWNRLNNYKPFVLFAENYEGECLAFCTGVVARVGKSKTKYHDKTALIYGGPLFLNDGYEIRDQYIKKLEGLLKLISRYTEIRNLGHDLYLKDNFTNLNWTYTPKLNYLISLDSVEGLLSRFNSNKRRQIRQSLKNGVELCFKKTQENIKSIYDINSKIFLENDKKMTLPIPDLNFMIDLAKMKNSGLVVIKFEDQIIGGAIFIYDNITAYGWFRGSLRKFKHLNPDSVLDWAVMKFGVEHQLKLFDFMGAGRKGWDNGIRRYKSRFGGELVENGMYSKASYPIIFRVQNKIRRMINN